MGEEPRFKIRTRCIVWGATVALLLGSSVSGEAASYTFTKLADTNGEFKTFGYASINDEGTVAFTAALVPVGTAIYTSDGTTPTTVADTSGKFNLFSNSVTIDNKGVVAFKAFLDAGGHGIFSSDGTTITTLADASRGGPYARVENPSMNDNGTVAFFGIVQWPLRGIFKSDGSTTTTVADTNTDGPNGKFNGFQETASINDKDTVAYEASDRLGWGIFTDEGTTPTTIAHTSDPLFSGMSFPSINNKDTVAFLATLDAGGSGVFMDNGTAPTTVSDSSGPFLWFAALSVNDEGSVAFLATADNGVRGIFTGPDPSTDKVIAVGDTLPPSGSTVKNLLLGREGLNSLGQLAIVVQFLDESWAVYRADPAASDLEVVVDVKPGGNPNMINMKSNGKVPVAILTTDSFDATAVDPKTVTLAGAPVVMKKNGSIMAAFEDVNADGRLDMVVHVETQQLQLNTDDTEAVVEGQTLDEKAFKGSDSVVVR